MLRFLAGMDAGSGTWRRTAEVDAGQKDSLQRFNHLYFSLAILLKSLEIKVLPTKKIHS
jgi:hypothetical protein